LHVTALHFLLIVGELMRLIDFFHQGNVRYEGNAIIPWEIVKEFFYPFFP
jgi:hypothetical protein